MGLLLDRDFDGAALHFAAGEHRPHFFAGAFEPLGRVGRFDADIEAGRLRGEQVEQPFLDAAFGFRLHAFQLLFADQADGVFDQFADHAFDIAAVVADFGVLGGLDLDERGAGERGEAAGDFGFADAGRADHEDVLGGDLVPHVVFQPLPPPAIADRNRDGPLGIVLADNVAVEFGDDLSGG